MSCEKGNTRRTRAQKHKNTTVFKNDLHHNSHVVKKMNAMDIVGVCERCKGIIEWRIKYSRYTPLRIPKKCVKCLGKTVCYAYHIMCLQCAHSKGVCAKCGTSDKEVLPCAQTPTEVKDQKIEIEEKLKSLPERKRRTILRKMSKGESLEEALAKLETMFRESGMGMDIFDDGDFDGLTSDDDEDGEQNSDDED